MSRDNNQVTIENICVHAEKVNDCNDHVAHHFCMLSTKLKEGFNYNSGSSNIFYKSSLLDFWHISTNELLQLSDMPFFPSFIPTYSHYLCEDFSVLTSRRMENRIVPEPCLSVGIIVIHRHMTNKGRDDPSISLIDEYQNFTRCVCDFIKIIILQ